MRLNPEPLDAPTVTVVMKILYSTTVIPAPQDATFPLYTLRVETKRAIVEAMPHMDEWGQVPQGTVLHRGNPYDHLEGTEEELETGSVDEEEEG